MLSALSKLNEDLFCLQSTLQLFHQITEAMLSIVHIESEDDRHCYLKFFIIITRNWKLLEINMKNLDYYSTATDVVCNLIDYINHPYETSHEEKVLTTIVTDKILVLIKFALDEKGPISELRYELFCNFFFSLLLKSDDLLTCKIQMLNLYFKLKGYNILRNRTINDAGTVKSRKIQLLLVEVMIHFTKIMQNITDECKVAIVRKGFYKIMLKQASEEDHHHADMIKILNTYVKLKLNLIGNNEEFLTTVSDIIVKFNAEKFTLDTNFLVMLITIFTEFFKTRDSCTSQKRRSVSKASDILKRSCRCVAPEITESFIKWWLFENSSKQEEYEKLLLSHISREVFDAQSTAIYDNEIKWLEQLYLDGRTAKRARINILQILSQDYVMTRIIEIKKILARLEICLKKEVTFEICGILKILCVNSSKFSLQGVKTVAPYVHQIFDTKIKSIEMRNNTLQLSEALLLRVFSNSKRTVGSLSFND